jgi:ubiquitin carboxyl-terminal hydrolase 4/11/15
MYGMMYAQIAGQEKVNELVDFPTSGLDMRDYVLSLKDEPQPILYDLYAVSNHYGSLNGGHYTAFCKNAPTDKWYHFNDSSVSPVPPE